MTREREYWEAMERECGRAGARAHFEREERGEEVPLNPEVYRKFKEGQEGDLRGLPAGAGREKIKHKGAD